jgi:nucleotide-binding universal stress UspA family protein
VTAPSPAARPRLVVGHDGSNAADAALRWALERAVARGWAVDAVRSWDLPLTAWLNPVPPSSEDLRAVEKTALTALEDAVGAARAAVPGAGALDARLSAPRGRASRALAEHSPGAALVVVGRRGAGGIRQLLGATSTAVLRAARCPVALVPPAPPTGSRVVVGVDGSARAQQALDWAAADAAATGSALEVVLAWQIATLHDQVREELAVVPPLSAYERRAQEIADAAARRAVERTGLSPAAVTARVVHAHAARALLDAAADAALLVVGSRGLGGFAGLALGSTSDQVSRHAPCPVVVVRDSAEPVEDDPPGEPDA